MCGIVGYVGKREALPLLIDSLKRLEYRGYDSSGIAFQNGNGIEIYKAKGKIGDLQQILPCPSPHATVGLGHTRWATHGEPSTRNAHPHSAGGVVVVHNGIIENYRELKSHLLSEGHQFLSDTDTEVIPQLISHYQNDGFSLREAIKESISLLKGSFAVGIMSDTLPGTLFAIKRGSPLVIGVGEGEFFFASDTPAILPYSNKFIFLDDGNLCTLTTDELALTCLATEESLPLEQRIVKIDWTPSMTERGGYDHFMLKEIYEQPQTVANTFAEWIKDPESLLDESDLSFETTLGLRRLQIVACGTSYHAALIGKYMIEKLARVPVDIDIASEYRYRKPILEKGTLFITITQSGETADTLAAQREAKERGARALTICNVVGSTLSREADAVLYTRAGPEIGVASTKAFTAQLTALYLLALGLGMRRGKLTYKALSTLTSRLREIPACILRALQKDSVVKECAQTMVYAKECLYLGRGMNYPIALEGALKLKEIAYLHAEGYPAGEMKHGPIALVEEGVPVVTVAPRDDLFEKMASNIEEVKARRGRIIVITDAPEAFLNKVDEVIEIPVVHPSLSPLITVIPLQLLAYHIAVMRGCDVDQPRNLAKSVTVE